MLEVRDVSMLLCFVNDTLGEVNVGSGQSHPVISSRR
jgi:hypothetical protein